MAAPKGCCAGRCLTKAFIAVAVIVVIIVIASVVILNQTPESLKIADMEFSGTTIRELGFADVKILDFLKAVRSILNPDEKSLLTNTPQASDISSANQKLIDTGVAVQAGGSPDYLWLLNNSLFTDEREVLKVTDKEFSVIMNGMVSQGASGTNEDAQKIKDMNGQIAQVVITQGKLEVLIVIEKGGLDISDIPSFLVPDKLYIKSSCILKVNADGSMTAESDSVSINGMESTLSEKLLTAIRNKADSGSNKPAKDFINEAVGNLFVTIAGNIGEAGIDEANIGKASAVGSGFVFLVTRQEIIV